MTSNLGKLFLSIQSLISGLADNSGNKYFRFVDQELGQLEATNTPGRYPVSWPCVLIDIDEMAFKTNGKNTQQGEGKICLRLGFPAFSLTSNLGPDEYRQKALYYYDLEQIIHQALQGTIPEYIENGTDVLSDVFGHFNRISAKTEFRTDSSYLRVRQLTYSLNMYDYSTEEQTILTPVAINLNETLII